MAGLLSFKFKCLNNTKNESDRVQFKTLLSKSPIDEGDNARGRFSASDSRADALTRLAVLFILAPWCEPRLR
jgi:hypothetical protein